MIVETLKSNQNCFAEFYSVECTISVFVEMTHTYLKVLDWFSSLVQVTAIDSILKCLCLIDCYSKYMKKDSNRDSPPLLKVFLKI